VVFDRMYETVLGIHSGSPAGIIGFLIDEQGFNEARIFHPKKEKIKIINPFFLFLLLLYLIVIICIIKYQ
jgi:hypothetical protein